MWADADAPRQGAPEGVHAFIQWKGTDVCLDFYCECGEVGHFDGYFAYELKCPTCGVIWEMPHYLVPRPYVSDGTPRGDIALKQAKVIDLD